jgi:exopolyphosphatase/guanosine-5'-triphosphate,3'-diphosphate pyrophosphatase
MAARSKSTPGRTVSQNFLSSRKRLRPICPRMSPVRRAVIDVGTNSVKLLVADVGEDFVTPVFEESEQTRLGRGFYETHELQTEAIAHTAQAVANFAAIARARNALSLRIIATSAARDARNQGELVAAIQRAAGFPVEIISGEQEAEWVYQGVRSDPKLAGLRLLILDVGGGSSEFIIGQDEHPQFSRSFPLGSVRLLEELRPSDPPTQEELERCRAFLRDFFATQIRPVVAPPLAAQSPAARLIGTGGAATSLARMEYSLDKYSRHAIEGARIPLESIERWMAKLWAMTLMDRRQIVGLPKKRADVILTGMAIYEAVLKEFGFSELHASTRGLRFAAAMQPVPPPARSIAPA